MKYFILFGPPGAGKGTQAAAMVEKYNLRHISTGALLREEIAKGSELGLKAKALIDDGQLVPDEVVEGMIENTFKTTKGVSGFLLDGFPRTIAQAEALKSMLAERGDEMGVMIELIVDEETLLARLLNRAIEQGRADDNEETIKKRFAVYHEQTEPLSAWFEGEGIRHTFTWKGDKDLMLSEIFAFLDKR